MSAERHHGLPGEVWVVVAPEMPVSSGFLVALVAASLQVQPLQHQEGSTAHIHTNT